MMGIAITAGAALLVGFLAGLLVLRARTRWCPSCGRSLVCASCQPVATTALRESKPWRS